MSTPYLDEAERCSRVAMMNKGEIIAMDEPQKIKDSINKEVLEIVCRPTKTAYKVVKENTEFDVQIFGDRINIVLDNYDENYPAIKKILDDNSINIIDRRKVTPTLENVFIYKIKEAS
jgi:ABC-2 type transport system ATP-binding protein